MSSSRNEEGNDKRKTVVVRWSRGRERRHQTGITVVVPRAGYQSQSSDEAGLETEDSPKITQSNMQSWAGRESSCPLRSLSSSLTHLSLGRLGCQACPQQASTFPLVEAAVPPPLATSDRSQARNITSLK